MCNHCSLSFTITDTAGSLVARVCQQPFFWQTSFTVASTVTSFPSQRAASAQRVSALTGVPAAKSAPTSSPETASLSKAAPLSAGAAAGAAAEAAA